MSWVKQALYYMDSLGLTEQEAIERVRAEREAAQAPQQPTGDWISLAMQVFPNSRYMTPEERRDFEAANYAGGEPITFEDENDHRAPRKQTCKERSA